MWKNAIVVRNEVLLCSVIDHMTLIFDLWPWNLQGIVACGVGNLSTNFGVRTFRSRLIGQHLSDASCDLATFTFDLGGHGARHWYGSSCSVSVPSLNFVGLPVRKILGIYCVSINPPGDLDLWPLNPKTVTLLYHIPRSFPTPSLNTLGSFVFELCCGQTDRQTNRLTRKSYPRRPTESAWVMMMMINIITILIIYYI